MPEFLRANVAYQMGRAIGVAVHVAIETGRTPMRPLRAPILGLVELLLGERSYQQTKALKLFRVQDAIKQFEEVLDGDQLSLRDVPQVRPSGQKDRRRKFR